MTEQSRFPASDDVSSGTGASKQNGDVSHPQVKPYEADKRLLPFACKMPPRRLTEPLHWPRIFPSL